MAIGSTMIDNGKGPEGITKALYSLFFFLKVGDINCVAALLL